MSVAEKIDQRIENDLPKLTDIHSYEVHVRRLKVLSKSQTALLKVNAIIALRKNAVKLSMFYSYIGSLAHKVVHWRTHSQQSS